MLCSLSSVSRHHFNLRPSAGILPSVYRFMSLMIPDSTGQPDRVYRTSYSRQLVSATRPSPRLESDSAEPSRVGVRDSEPSSWRPRFRDRAIAVVVPARAASTVVVWAAATVATAGAETTSEGGTSDATKAACDDARMATTIFDGGACEACVWVGDARGRTFDDGSGAEDTATRGG